MMLFQKYYGQLYLQEQGWKINQNKMMCKNVSYMTLESNGKLCFGKRTCHFVIKKFNADLINCNEIKT
jgi:hypothetical protein